MPIHDWTRVEAGTFHHFHQMWIANLCDVLNGDVLPSGYFSLADQSTGGPMPDVVTLRRTHKTPAGIGMSGAVAVADAPPRARHVRSAEIDIYADRADRIVIRHSLGEVVAVIEILSPGNKSTMHGIRSFVQKAEAIIRAGVNLLVVDLFPPTPRDPHGVHKEVWSTIEPEAFELPEAKPLTVAAYCAMGLKTAYVEPVAVGDPLPSLPIFLEEGMYVPAPLEESYQRTWDKCPGPIKGLFE